MHSCALITTSADQMMQPIHHRMPVIIKNDALDLWLSASEDVALLKPHFSPYDDDSLQAWQISKRVNSPANDAPELVNPV